MWLTNILQILNLMGPAMFTALRIYALSRKNKILGGVALVLSMVPFVINASAAYQILPINLPAPLNCSVTNMASRSLNVGGSLILVDSLAATVTWWYQTHAVMQLRTGTTKRPSLEQVMWENGTVYFCILVSMNAADMVLVLLSIALLPLKNQSSYVVVFIDPISSILNSRFLLALHETSAQLKGAAEASISSLSLNTGSSDDPQGGSEPPELPEFLGIIGGLIRSFHCDDKDLGSLKFTPPWEEHEPDSEPEGEIQEIRRDGGNIA